MDNLEQEFRSQYEKGDVPDNVLTAPPDKMLAAIGIITTAVLRVRLPELAPEVRTLMVGQLTPAHRELLMALVQVLTDEPDLAREAGFGVEVFQGILDGDIELENLGVTLDRLVRAYIQAESKQNGALLVMNNKALLAVSDLLDQLRAQGDRDGVEVLEGIFGAALAAQAELTARQPAPATKDSAAPPRTIKGLRDQLDEAQKDANVRQAVAAIETAAAHLPEAQAAPAGSLGAPAAKGKGRSKTKAKTNTNDTTPAGGNVE